MLPAEIGREFICPSSHVVMAGLDPAIPLIKALSCHGYRDRRVKPGDDGT
jgi:hypothetical protein